MNTFLSSLAIAAFAFTATPALANGQDAKRVSIRHADLDLSSHAGRVTLDRRIASATESVCGSYAGARDNEEREIAMCRADAARQITTQLASQVSKTTLAAR